MEHQVDRGMILLFLDQLKTIYGSGFRVGRSKGLTLRDTREKMEQMKIGDKAKKKK